MNVKLAAFFSFTLFCLFNTPAITQTVLAQSKNSPPIEIHLDLSTREDYQLPSETVDDLKAIFKKYGITPKIDYRRTFSNFIIVNQQVLTPVVYTEPGVVRPGGLEDFLFRVESAIQKELYDKKYPCSVPPPSLVIVDGGTAAQKKAFKNMALEIKKLLEKAWDVKLKKPLVIQLSVDFQGQNTPWGAEASCDNSGADHLICIGSHYTKKLSRSSLAHEMQHAYTNELFGILTSLWSEGLSEFFENRLNPNNPNKDNYAILRNLVFYSPESWQQRIKLILTMFNHETPEEMSAEINQYNKANKTSFELKYLSPEAYSVSFYFTEFIINTYDWKTYRDFLSRTGRTETTHPPDQNQIAQEIFKKPLDGKGGLFDEFIAQLPKQLRFKASGQEIKNNEHKEVTLQTLEAYLKKKYGSEKNIKDYDVYFLQLFNEYILSPKIDGNVIRIPYSVIKLPKKFE